MSTRRSGERPLLLHERVSLAAAGRLDATAIVMGSERVSYGQLERESNQLARLLIERGLRHGERVILLQPKAPVAIVSMLATLKAGGIYVPVDISSPPARVQRILDSAAPRLILATSRAAALVDRLDLGAELGTVDGELPGSAFGPAAAASFDADVLPGSGDGSAEDPAHILFTSGSTGVPKGVLITHAMVGAFLDWALAYFGHRPGERSSGHAPLHFDLSTFDIYGALCSGGELHLPPPATLLPAQLASFVRESELTQWFSVPSTFAYMVSANAIEKGDFPSLRRVIWCGEVLAPAVLAQWMARVPTASYTNLYGPTEATIASSFYTVPSGRQDLNTAIPIGAPCTGERIHVLDPQLAPRAPGDVGELYIEGAGLSPGYWRDPESTRAAFITIPDGGRRLYRTGDLGRRDEDGLLHYAGRVDSQIKSRGYRIELGEIETALSAVSGVAECAVLAVPSEGFDGTAICCAWAPAAGAALDRPALRRALAETLPSYMLPSRWLECEQQLPRNPSGKIDRRRLTASFAQPASARGRSR
jgi:amino acid adenylation domain-containing protein